MPGPALIEKYRQNNMINSHKKRQPVNNPATSASYRHVILTGKVKIHFWGVTLILVSPLQSPLSTMGKSEWEQASTTFCLLPQWAYSQPESPWSRRLLLQFRHSSEVWKCLKQSQQFSDPLQYQTLQLCVTAAMLEWGQLL